MSPHHVTCLQALHSDFGTFYAGCPHWLNRAEARRVIQEVVKGSEETVWWESIFPKRVAFQFLFKIFSCQGFFCNVICAHGAIDSVKKTTETIFIYNHFPFVSVYLGTCSLTFIPFYLFFFSTHFTVGAIAQSMFDLTVWWDPQSSFSAMRRRSFQRKKRLVTVDEGSDEPAEEPSPYTSVRLRLAVVDTGRFVSWAGLGGQDLYMWVNSHKQ